MAARFFKKGPTPEYAAALNSTYKDLYDSNVLQMDIQSGTVNNFSETKMVAIDFKLPVTPSYGSAELKSGKVGIYVDDTAGGTNYKSVVKSYKLKTEIGNNKGGKASATGSIITNNDIVQISAYHSNELPYIIEDMSGDTETGTSFSLGYEYEKGGMLYLTKEKGYDMGNNYGDESWNIKPYSRDHHFEMFGTNHPTLGEIYIIEAIPLSVFGSYRTIKTHQMSDGKYYPEKYSSVSSFGMNSGGITQYIKYAGITMGFGSQLGGRMKASSFTEIERERITTKNTIFYKVKEDLTFTDGSQEGYKEVAFANLSQSPFSRKGKNSLEFASMYPHRYNVTQQIYYPQRRYGGSLVDGSENQQVSFVSAKLPKPPHLYTRQPLTTADGRQPVTPAIEIDINIESLAPMLVRNQHTVGLPTHDFRLTRAMVITFGEEEARGVDNLYSYFRRHAPNSTGAGTGSNTGAGTSAKSFYGLAFVMYEGEVAYYNIGNAGLSGSTYTDSTFRLDDTRGEVCFAAAPTKLSEDELLGQWFTLNIQTHPDDQGAVWCAHEPESKDVLTENTPYTTQKLTNLKNITASSSGVWANNIDDWPKHMTIWNSNYQSIKGSYNTDAQLYETGLRAGNSGSGATGLEVYGVQDSTAVNGTVQKTAGNRFASYLLIDRGDMLTLGTASGGDLSTDILVSENDNSIDGSRGNGQLTVAADNWTADDTIYHAGQAALQDSEIVQDHFDCMTKFFVDEIRIQHFSMINSNATPTDGVIPADKLYIPAAVKLDNTAWQDGTSTVANIKDNRTQQPSYICLGFDDLTDLTGPQGLGTFTNATCDTNHTSNTTTVTHDADSRIVAGLQVSGTGITAGTIITSITNSTSFVISNAATATNNNQTLTFEAIKYIHMNGYSSQKAPLDDNIVTNVNSDISNIRVGYSSTLENYGRQNAANSTAGSVPDTGSAESAVFSNANGTPDIDFRGLRVGDLDTAANEFSVEANASDLDGVGNVDYFSHKGLMKFRFGYRKVGSASTTLANADDSNLLEGQTEVKVADGSTLVKNDMLLIGDEIVKIAQIVDDAGDGAFTPATLTLRRAQHGTTAAIQADGSNVFKIAMPEKRECIFASCRILKIENENSLVVDNSVIFNNKPNQDYIFYKYDDSHSAPSDFTSNTARVVSVKNNVVTFNQNHGLTDNTCQDYLISPQRYWLIIEVLNIGGLHGWQDDTNTGDTVTKYLPAKAYENVVQIFEKGNYGTTFNETKYTDAGDYQNKWSVTLFDNTNDSAVELKDYGFGDYDENTNEGGHNGILAMNLADADDTYQYIDLAKTFEVDEFKGSDTLPLLLTTGTLSDDFKVTIDSELGTNKPYLLAQYEDEVPRITSFTMLPNEIDPYNIDFKWECADTDLWYGFIMVDANEVNTQYSGAVLHYKMNEEGIDGTKATAPIDNIQSMTTAVDSGNTTGPFYSIEGLSGNALSFSTTGSPSIDIGTGSADPLASTGLAVTDEFSVNMHIIPDAEIDGTLSQTNCLIGSSQRIFVKMKTDRTVFVQLYWDSDSAISLTSSSKVICDGETPTNIMVTFDANLTSGNVKLFINGKLEDLTGECITSDASGVSQTSWLFQQNMNSNTNKIFLANTSDSGSQEYEGRMEEVVFYNRCLYPVNPNDKSFTFTKPLKELSESSAKTGSIPYSAKLFIKDYHNIRGTTIDEVASSAPLSFKKAAFRLDNS